MSYSRFLPLLCALGLLSASAVQADNGVVTIYSADGLRDGHPNWYDTQFDAFTKQTGIKVQYIEGGSGVVVNRVDRERTNAQADVLVTLPPFIQKAAADGLLQPYTPAEADAIPADSKDRNGHWYALVNNYFSYIYNGHVLKHPPRTFDDLLHAQYKNKLQYSTPGQAGDGTAMMISVFHAYGSKDAGFEYFRKLQTNNVGPSSSTGKLAAKVNKGEIWVANGDLQMNFAQMADNPNLRIFWLANHKGERATFSIPYAIGLVKDAPHAANGKKLIDFLLSKQAQLEVSSIAGGFPARSDVHPTDANFQKLHGYMKGVKIWTPDWDKVLKDLQEDVATWHKVTGS